MNFCDTFLFEIVLGRSLNVYECLAYDHDWCEFCGEDTDGIMFCGECGSRQSHKSYEYVEEDGTITLSRDAHNYESESEDEEEDDCEYDEDDLFASLIVACN